MESKNYDIKAYSKILHQSFTLLHTEAAAPTTRITVHMIAEPAAEDPVRRTPGYRHLY